MNIVESYNIDGAWRDLINLCVREGKDFVVKGGSYVGQIRKQLEYVNVIINNPESRPLSPIMPPGIPGPTSDEKIERYFQKYIFCAEKGENEVYTYGEFIMAQYNQCAKLLIDSNGNTNQATICVGDKTTTFLEDPPCLRSISFKVVDGKLNVCVYFRSWDLYAGLPENLGGIQMLNEMMSIDTGFPTGKIIAFSDGLHLYEQYFGLVDLLSVQKIEVSSVIIKDKSVFNK